MARSPHSAADVPRFAWKLVRWHAKAALQFGFAHPPSQEVFVRGRVSAVAGGHVPRRLRGAFLVKREPELDVAALRIMADQGLAAIARAECVINHGPVELSRRMCRLLEIGSNPLKPMKDPGISGVGLR